MAKQTDITGTVRIPEEHMGRFWNFMRSMPTCEFTPIVAASDTPAKRAHGKTANGSTGKCVVLHALTKTANLTTKGITTTMTSAGKAAKSAPNVIFELKRDKLIRQNADKSYSITAAGKTFISENCKGE